MLLRGVLEKNVCVGGGMKERLDGGERRRNVMRI